MTKQFNCVNILFMDILKLSHTMKVGNLYFHKCLRCGYEWANHKETQKRCANIKCTSPYWDEERKGDNNATQTKTP